MPNQANELYWTSNERQIWLWNQTDSAAHTSKTTKLYLTRCMEHYSGELPHDPKINCILRASDQEYLHASNKFLLEISSI